MIGRKQFDEEVSLCVLGDVNSGVLRDEETSRKRLCFMKYLVPSRETYCTEQTLHRQQSRVIENLEVCKNELLNLLVISK